MFLRKTLSAMLTVLALTAVTYAQQKEAVTQEKMASSQEVPREDRRHGGMGRQRGFAGMRELNLTEEQRQQQRAILQRQLGTTKAQREELFKLRERRFAGTLTPEDEARAQSLRSEIRDSMQSMRSELEGVLTTEQRAQLEQLRTERKARRNEMREHRRKRREPRDLMPR